MITYFQFIANNRGWENLKSIIKIKSTRELKTVKELQEKQADIIFLACKTMRMNFKKKIHSHWAVDNKLHWTLDVAFSEGAYRKRARNTAQNYSILLNIALNILKNKTSKKLSIKSKRLEARCNEDYLLRILKLKV